MSAPAVDATAPVDWPGLHNVVAYYDDFYSGGAPEGREGFALLADLGIVTIISVDGAAPDVEAARTHDMQYIHLPIGYDGIEQARVLELTRATRDSIANGPVYVHCHHGKHRSAGAAGAIAVSLGWLTHDEAVARMRVSGTSNDYPGLYAAAATATRLSDEILDAVAANFPAVSRPAGITRTMVEIDFVNDNLKAIRDAGWQTPADHPDLVPAAEVGRLVDLMRFLKDDPSVQDQPGDFFAQLDAALGAANALEALVTAREPVPAEHLTSQFALIGQSCKSCHRAFRN
ncbi:MAG: cytochrome c [Planctomycetes bacterium]|nr:cytochrome c [Planctomycetota bacterium]